MVTEWQQSQRNRKDRNRSLVEHANKKPAKWKPPQEGQLKINVDASLSRESDSFGLGMVIRDDNGMFLLGKVIRLQHVEIALDAETRGVLEALKWAAGEDLRDVRVEIDSLLTVQTLEGHATTVLEVDHVTRNAEII
ncbi:hypothetical protein AgCh_039324 [Apium graveolens]